MIVGRLRGPVERLELFNFLELRLDSEVFGLVGLKGAMLCCLECNIEADQLHLPVDVNSLLPFRVNLLTLLFQPQVFHLRD